MKTTTCRILPVFLFVFLSASQTLGCWFLQNHCAKGNFPYYLNPVWFTPVVTNGACLNSILSDPKEKNRCVSWNRREIAGPLFDESRGLIYVGGSDGMLHIVSAKDGRSKKNIRLPGNLKAKPILSNNHLFFGTDNGIVLKMNVESFQIVWQIEVDAEVEHSLVLNDQTVFFISGLSTVYAVDAQTGEIKWNRKRPLPSKIFIANQSKPLLVNLEDKNKMLVLVCGHPSGQVDLYEAKTGKTLFNIMIGDPTKEFPDIVATPVYDNGSIIVASFNKGIASLEPGTGEVQWRFPENKKTRLLAANGMIYAAGSHSVIGINYQKGKIIWRFTFQNGAPTNMVLKNNFLYFASDRNALYVLEASTGRPVRYFGSGLGFAGDFDFSSNMLFLVSTTGNLYAMSPGFEGFVQSGK